MRTRAVLAALAVVLAGCAGVLPGGGPGATTTTPTTSPTATSTASPTPTPAVEKVTVTNGSLSFDPDAVYRAVVAMHGMRYADAPTVELAVRPTPEGYRTRGRWSSTPFMRLWGFRGPVGDPNESVLAGLAAGTRVFLYTDAATTTAERKAVLAHEFTHVVQHDRASAARVGTALGNGDNAPRLETAVIEGAAAYVAGLYARRHLDGRSPDRSWAAFVANHSLLEAYVVAPYFLGERYVRGRVDSPANLTRVYRNPPRTTEQLVHGYAPDEEPARPLAVEAEARGSLVTADDRVRGELFVRIMLAGHLSAERAARAAAGWGADRLVVFRRSTVGASEPGYAWVLRWDGPAEAEEFAAAMTDYLDRHAVRTDGRWRTGETTVDLRRVSEETVVVVAGSGSFVDGTTVGGDGRNVTVTAGG